MIDRNRRGLVLAAGGALAAGAMGDMAWAAPSGGIQFLQHSHVIRKLHDRYLKIKLDLFLSWRHNLNCLLYLPPRK